MNSSWKTGATPQPLTNAPPLLGGLRHTMLSSETLALTLGSPLEAQTATSLEIWEAEYAPVPLEAWERLRPLVDGMVGALYRPRRTPELQGLDRIWLHSLQCVSLQRLRTSRVEPRHLDLRVRRKPCLTATLTRAERDEPRGRWCGTPAP